jgi:hypothetical protein
MGARTTERNTVDRFPEESHSNRLGGITELPLGENTVRQGVLREGGLHHGHTEHQQQ